MSIVPLTWITRLGYQISGKHCSTAALLFTDTLPSGACGMTFWRHLLRSGSQNSWDSDGGWTLGETFRNVATQRAVTIGSSDGRFRLTESTKFGMGDGPTSGWIAHEAELSEYVYRRALLIQGAYMCSYQRYTGLAHSLGYIVSIGGYRVYRTREEHRVLIKTTRLGLILIAWPRSPHVVSLPLVWAGETCPAHPVF